MPQDLQALRDQHAELTLRREIAQTTVDIQALTKAAELGSVLHESFGDSYGWGSLVDRREYLRDDKSFGYTPLNISQIDDRADGKFRPIYESEVDLQIIRGGAHQISADSATAINILDNLDHYTIGDGFEHQAQPAIRECPKELVAAVQYVLDDFFDKNDWKSDLESEGHHRSREDGEAPLLLIPQGWRTKASYIEPDQITQPAQPSNLESWLGCDEEFVSSWSFGVHTKSRDHEPIGYHVVYDGAGRDWDYYPCDDVRTAIKCKSGLLHVIKRNTPRVAKRGVSDFYPVLTDLAADQRLSRRTVKGASIQAAIALIRQHAPGTTASQIRDMRRPNATGSFEQAGPYGGRTIDEQSFPDGAIIDSTSQVYQYGPMGQSSAPNWVDILAQSLRRVGLRWCFPEFMISSDSSNNNLASIQLSGTHFVQARKADQRFYGSRYHKMDWTIVRIAFEGGFFSKFNLKWDDLERLVNIRLKAPEVRLGETFEDAQKREVERRNGVLSAHTWAIETGRKPEEEQAYLKAETKDGFAPVAAGKDGQVDGSQGGIGGADDGTGGGDPSAGGGGNPAKPAQPPMSGPFANSKRRDWQNNNKAIMDVLGEVAKRVVTPGQGAAKLQALGLPPELAQALLADVADDGKLEPQNAQKLAESLLETFLENCGTGAGGFKADNNCASGGHGSTKGSDGYADHPKFSVNPWNHRGRGLWDALMPSGEKTVDGVTDSQPFTAKLQTVSSSFFELDTTDHEHKLAIDIKDKLGEAPREFTFENVRTGYGDEKNKFGLTGTGHAKEVVGKASDLLIHALRTYSPKVVYYTAAEKSRDGLYEFLTARVGRKAPYTGYRVTLPNDSRGMFALVRNDATGDFEALARGKATPLSESAIDASIASHETAGVRLSEASLAADTWEGYP